MKRKTFLLTAFLTLIAILPCMAQWLLIPMDEKQTNHLKAYGLTYWALEPPREYRAEWLLNYRSGSFLLVDQPDVRQKAVLMGVYFEPIGNT